MNNPYHTGKSAGLTRQKDDKPGVITFADTRANKMAVVIKGGHAALTDLTVVAPHKGLYVASMAVCRTGEIW